MRLGGLPDVGVGGVAGQGVLRAQRPGLVGEGAPAGGGGVVHRYGRVGGVGGGGQQGRAPAGLVAGEADRDQVQHRRAAARTRPVAVSSRVVSARCGWAPVMTTAVPVLPRWAATRSSSWPTTGVCAWAGSSSSIRAGQVSSPAWWARAVTVSRSSSVARSIAVTVSARTVSATTVCAPRPASAGASPPPLGGGGVTGAWWGRIRSGLSGATSAAGPMQCTVTPADQGLQAISAAMYRARSAALVGSPVRVTVRSSKLSSHGLPVSVVPTVTSSGYGAGWSRFALPRQVGVGVGG